MKNILFLLSGIFLLCCCSCKKEQYTEDPGARILFSSDTLFFDTVFTTVGSVTQSFKIINPNDQKLKISSIKLAGGKDSPFQLNINGVPGSSLQNETLRADDSLYVFVQVRIDPNNLTQPFIIRDSVEVAYNGNTRYLQLRAYGQNAIFLHDKKIASDTVWDSHLPIVISGSLTVEQEATLRILEGSRIYFHATAPLLVNGSLDVWGTPSDPVIFSGDRTDADYKDLPASWPGIYLTSQSKQNHFRSAVVRNAFQGLIVDQPAADNQPKLILSQSIIENIYDAGILALNSSIEADNTLVANCGSNIALLLGGNYHFVNCTVATYGSFYITHKNPVLQLSDHFEQDGTLYTAPMNASFVNSIFWGDNGSVENEVFVSKKGTAGFEVVLENCIYKAKDVIPFATLANNLVNTPPLFDSINPSRDLYDFHFRRHPESPAIKAGKPVPFFYDLDGRERMSPPDIGCYER